MGRSRRPAPRAPAHFSPRARAFWQFATSEFQLEPHHIELVRLVGEAIDRGEQARLAVAKEGLTIKDRFAQLRPHPGIAIERNAALVVGRLIKQLGLDLELPEHLRGRPI